jgi:Protein of unknown function (DUF1360)
MNHVPDVWPFLLLAVAAYRMWHLLAEDTILDRPRRWFLRLGSDWQAEGDPVPPGYRAKHAEFLTCPWCAGFWIGVVWWAAWLAWPEAALIAAVPFAISAVVALVNAVVDALTE